MLCASTHDVETKNAWHQYQIVLLLDGIRLETYLLPHLVHPRLLRPPSGSPFHGCRPGHGLLVLVVVLLILLRCWKLAAAKLLSSGNDSSSDLIPHNGDIHDLLLVLVGCWGRKARHLVALPLVLVSSLLVVLMVLLLLLLRELPLIPLLVLALMLMLVTLRGTLLELLGWIA
jgi:hypothetical protein